MRLERPSSFGKFEARGTATAVNAYKAKVRPEINRTICPYKIKGTLDAITASFSANVGPNLISWCVSRRRFPCVHKLKGVDA
jgi:hypothetical protein